MYHVVVETFKQHKFIFNKLGIYTKGKMYHLRMYLFTLSELEENVWVPCCMTDSHRIPSSLALRHTVCMVTKLHFEVNTVFFLYCINDARLLCRAYIQSLLSLSMSDTHDVVQFCSFREQSNNN